MCSRGPPNGHCSPHDSFVVQCLRSAGAVPSSCTCVSCLVCRLLVWCSSQPAAYMHCVCSAVVPGPPGLHDALQCSLVWCAMLCCAGHSLLSSVPHSSHPSCVAFL